ncbi:MAG: hypothetical protein N3A58_08155 [Spirochaetes bacterium]|nr:hypothetical protein [Spirochaetota bacterium]
MKRINIKLNKFYFIYFLNLFFLLYSCSNSFEVICSPNAILNVSLNIDNNKNIYNENDKIKIIFTIVDSKYKPVFSKIWDIENINKEQLELKLVPGKYFYYSILTKEWTFNENQEFQFKIKAFFYKDFIIKPYEKITIDQVFEDINLFNKTYKLNIINEYTFEFIFNENLNNLSYYYDFLFYYYSLYIYFDLNNDGKYDSKKDKSVRILKDNIEIIDRNNIKYKAVLYFDDKLNHMNQKIGIFSKTGIKIKTSLFQKNFFEINKIDKIYFLEEFKFIDSIYLKY